MYNDNIYNYKIISIMSSISKDKVQVLVRIRPFHSNQDQELLIQQINQQTLKIIRPGNDLFMKFNNILGTDASQADVFETIKDSVQSFLKGVDNTIFAYGQTGAGKTYTITGQTNAEEEDEADYDDYIECPSRGLLPRALQLVFDEVQARKQPNPRLYISFIQIYNDKVYDLLGNVDRPLDIKTSKNGTSVISDLQHYPVTDINEAIGILIQATYAHSRSSRSHSIFEIIYARTAIIKRGSKQEEFPIVSSLRIVDLAGSEKYKIPYNLTPAEREIHVQQLKSINSSLASLGHCISALGQKTRTHIPFRQSKLTRILSESLTGKGRLKLIICVSPSISAANETLTALQFANRAKKAIVDRPKTQTNIKENSSLELIQLRQQLQEQRHLRKTLQQMLVNKNSKSIVQQNIKLQKENIQLRKKLKQYQSKSLTKKSSPYKKMAQSPRKIHPITKGSSSVSYSKQKSQRNYYRPRQQNYQIQNNSSPDLEEATVSNEDIKYQLDMIKKAVQSNMLEFSNDVDCEDQLF